MIIQGPSIPLSPLKAAVYQRINEQNKVLADYVARLTEDKAELRTALTNLELQASKYREHEANNEEVSWLLRNLFQK